MTIATTLPQQWLRPAQPAPDASERVSQAVLRLVAPDLDLGSGSPHLARIRSFVARNEPIELILPAFPAKSPNPTKVLGWLPDMAERLGIEHLLNLCDAIGGIHAPGAQIVICSDGHVFGGLIGVTDRSIVAYARELDRLMPQELPVFRLEDRYPDVSFEAMRRCLLADHAPSLEELHEGVRSGQLTAFNGIHRFLFEDAIATEAGRSRNSIRKRCKERAYRVIQHSTAWGRLISELFPRAVRLSIHPQPAGSAKLGIRLVDSIDRWLTPWHGVAVQLAIHTLDPSDVVEQRSAGEFVLMRRSEAEALGARLVTVDGRPSHFDLSEAGASEVTRWNV